MKTRIQNNEQLREFFEKEFSAKDAETKTMVLKTLEKVNVQPIYLTDKLIYRMVVAALAIIVLIVIIGITLMMVECPGDDINKNIPVVVVSITSTALGALTGMLTSPSPKDPQK